MTTETPPELIDTLQDDDVANTSGVAGATVKDALETLDAGGGGGGFTLATEQATTSGTAKNFTGIPPGTKVINLMYDAVSLDSNDRMLIQIGDSGGIETSGYISVSDTTSVATAFTAGFGIRSFSAGDAHHGLVILTLEDSANNTWSASGSLAEISAPTIFGVAGGKSLSGELTQVRFALVAGNFDGGAVNISHSP